MPPVLAAESEDPSCRWPILGGTAVFLAQAALIVALLRQRRRRALAQVELQRLRNEYFRAARHAAVGELAAVMAHELNQPLGAILINAETAEMLLRQAADDPLLSEILADIRRADQRAGEIIRRFRRLFQRSELEPARVRLDEIVLESVRLVETDAALKIHTVQVEAAAHLPAVMGDKTHLQQVVVNLLLNAIDAVPAAGGRIRLNLAATAGEVHLTVEDCGPGIAAEVLPVIFRPFITGKPGGLGLGLSICRTIVEAHGGRITAANRDSGGAVFRVTLPIAGQGQP